MRIAIVTETFLPRVNGIVRMLVAYLDYLERHGHDAIVFAPGTCVPSCHGATVVPVSGVPFPPYPDVIVAPYSARLEPTLRAWRPDIIHLAGPFMLGRQGVTVARALGVPVAAHYQTDIAGYADHFRLGLLRPLAWRRLLDIHQGADVTFAPTPTVAEELRGRGMARVHVCGRGVDTALFHPDRRDAGVRARFTGGHDRPILLYVGRVSPEKNVSLLADVARALPYPLVVVGAGPALESLAAEVAPYDVHFTGTLHRDDLAAVYASADVILFPSTTETFGQAAHEAMASGLPVVGMRAGGVPDVVRDGNTGILCDSDDRGAFVEAARTLAEDPVSRRVMGEKGRRVAETHSWDAVFDHLMGWYAGLVATRRAIPTAAGQHMAERERG